VVREGKWGQIGGGGGGLKSRVFVFCAFINNLDSRLSTKKRKCSSRLEDLRAMKECKYEYTTEKIKSE